MKHFRTAVIIALFALPLAVGCKGGSSETGTDTYDSAFNQDVYQQDSSEDTQQEVLNPDIPSGTDALDITEEEIIPAECSKDSDCKDKFQDVDQCQQVKCNVTKGKCEVVNRPDGTVCDDNDLCTEDEKCVEGKCTNGHNVCQCTTNKDCVQFEDGNLCNGTLVCNLEKYPHVCEVDPATVVKCDSSKDTFCLANQCDPKTGTCSMQPAHEGEKCDDGSLCTIGDTCQNGECTSTDTIKCDASRICAGGKCDPECFDAKCDPKLGCVYTPNTAACDDNNKCTENDTCSGGHCKGTKVDCDDGVFCNGQESCDPETGCVAGTPPTCDDSNECSQDFCDPVLDKCTHSPLPGKVEGPMGDPTCSDGIDNDCDGLTDDKDPSCSLSFVGLDPLTGPTDGGTLVTLSGTGLTAVKEVLLGGKNVEFQVIDANTIQFTTPPHDPGNVDLEFGDGWAMVKEEGVFQYVGVASDLGIKVDITAPDLKPISAASPYPVITGKLTLQTRGVLPDNMKVQFGHGQHGTLPWKDPSWVWTDAKVSVISEGVYGLESNMGTASAGDYDLAVRVSNDNGMNFAYGAAGDDVLGHYDVKNPMNIVVYGLPGAGDIVISEIAWRGSSKNGHDEWIELYNKAKIPLLLDNLLITHAGNSDTDFVFNDPHHTIHQHVIDPGTYVVISELDKDESAINVTPAIVGNNTMYLKNNATLTYELKDNTGKVLDSAFFDGTFGGAGNSANGVVVKTMERNKGFPDGTKLSSWHTAYAHRGWDGDPLQEMNWGTPGQPNSDIPECSVDGECVKLFLNVEIGQCKQAKCLSNGTCAIVNAQDDTPCDDGLFCTDGDKCESGKCTAGPDRDCSDDSVCTLDSCDEKLGRCVHKPDPNAIEGPAGSETCSDGIDNDCDGKTDDKDPQCLLKVSKVTPDNCIFAGGCEVKISGAGFGIVKKVNFGQTNATFTMVDDQTITAMVPAGNAGDDVDVSVSDGTITAVLSSGFRFTGISDAKLFGNVKSPTQTINVIVNQPTDLIYGRVWGPDLPAAPEGVLAEVGYGPKDSYPDQDPHWIWFPAQYNADCSDCNNAYEFMGTISVPTPGTYLISYRYSIDGGYTFLYTTLGQGDAFDPSTALQIVVTPEENQ